jgi:hypothetical protein
LRWQAAQAVDHAIDFELDEISYINEYLSLLERIRGRIGEAKKRGMLSEAECQQMKNEIETAAAGINPVWIMEKFFGCWALMLGAGLTGMNLIRNADELLGMAAGFFQRRKKECLDIIRGIEEGNQKIMRQQVEAPAQGYQE